jgi:transcription elongation GreA/GreB family factor
MREHFVAELRRHYEEMGAIAARAGRDAQDAAAHMATESEKKEDARAAIEFGSLAAAQAERTRQARDALEQLALFVRRPMPDFSRGAAISLGAMVDISGADGERTFILLPVGAGTELAGPGGDGFVSVITPASPVGKALMGKRAGDTFDVQIKGDWHEWKIVDVG